METAEEQDLSRAVGEKATTHDGNGALAELYRGLQALADESFPRSCPNCHKTFETVEDFLANGTQPVFGQSGLRQSLDESMQPLVEVFRNCTCGSTLLEVFRERRDTSPAGRRRRAKFEQLLVLLQKTGLDVHVARRELLRILAGQESDILRRRGIHVKLRGRTRRIAP